MEVTLQGVHGASITRHLEKDISRALERVPIPRQNMENEHAINSGDWDKLDKGYATQMLIFEVTKQLFLFFRGS